MDKHFHKWNFIEFIAYPANDSEIQTTPIFELLLKQDGSGS
jgi:hypothetical protein